MQYCDAPRVALITIYIEKDLGMNDALQSSFFTLVFDEF